MAQIEARVGRRGKIRWRARIRVKGLPDKTETFTRKTDAVLWAQRIESDLREGRRVPSPEARRRTVAELLDRYRAEVLPEYSRREQAQRSGKLAWWGEQLGSRRLVELSAADISECRSRLVRGGALSGKPASPATQTRYLAVIKHALGKARTEWQWIAENPAELVKSPREPRGRVRFLSDEERERLLTACQESREARLYPLVLMALGTGARQGELLRLRWRDIDLDRGTAIVHKTKNNERRALVLSGKVPTVLKDFSTVRRIDCDELFASRRGVGSFPDDAWHVALKRAEILEFRFHDLRHTFASYLAMSGATLAELAEALGHKTLAMVKRYDHLTEQHTSGVVNRMTQRFLA